MIILKIFGALFAVVLIFVGLMFLVATASTAGLKIGGVFLIIAGISFFIIIFKGSKSSASGSGEGDVKIIHNVTVDLPEDAKLKEFLCKNCGASIKPENLKFTEAGSIMVTCPYCSTSYEIQEEPKW
ncbi:hypothetical protein KAU33_16840 [Candidatus Dependentiae bacterium]|nr:hypothetical protein [Candidatus Dependentiae bacterium]